MEVKSIRHIFLGYSGTQKGYMLYDEGNQRFAISRDVKFVENSFGGRLKIVNTIIMNNSPEIVSKHSEYEMEQGMEDSEFDDNSTDVNNNDTIKTEQGELPERVQSRRSLRERKIPSMYGDWVEGEELEQAQLVYRLGE